MTALKTRTTFVGVHLDTTTGVRPSPGAAGGDREAALERFPPSLVPNAAAPGDGRTPASSGSVVPVMEKFVRERLPQPEGADDYDDAGRVRLPAEYGEWFATSDNWLRTQAVVEARSASLRDRRRYRA